MSATNRTYGPLTPLHIKMLTEKLDKARGTYRVFTDDDLINQAQVREKNSPEASPFFHNTPGISMKEYLFIEIELKDLMLVRADLIKLGFEATLSDSASDSAMDASLLADEFICPKCSFVQNSRGLCHTHQIPLVLYFDKVQILKQKKDRRLRASVACFVAILVGFIAYSFFKI